MIKQTKTYFLATFSVGLGEIQSTVAVSSFAAAHDKIHDAQVLVKRPSLKVTGPLVAINCVTILL